MNIKITNNSGQVKEEMKEAVIRALEKCGLTGEGYAKKLCPVDTGNLRNSITHTVDTGEMAAYIGTNVEYGIYVEMGTGIHAANGGGRPTPWSYKDAKGNWHRTHGQKPQPFIKPAVADHMDKYRKLIHSELGSDTNYFATMDMSVGTD